MPTPMGTNSMQTYPDTARRSLATESGRREPATVLPRRTNACR